MNAEMDSRKWLWAGIGFQFGVGYTVAYFVYQIGTLITTGSFGPGAVPGFLGVAILAGVIAYLIRKNDQKVKIDLNQKVMHQPILACNINAFKYGFVLIHCKKAFIRFWCLLYFDCLCFNICISV